jgi:hypothetical protein
MLELEKSLQKEQTNIYTIYDLSKDAINRISTTSSEDYNKDALTKLASLRFQEQNILNEILPEYYI